MANPIPVVNTNEVPADEAAKIAAVEHGRVSDLAAKEAAARQEAADQAQIDADNAAERALADKAKADKLRKEREDAAEPERVAREKAEADKAAEEAKAKEAEDKNADGTWKEAYVEVGNEHADAAIDLLKEAGVSPVEANEIFKKAIDSGNIEDINWEVLEARLGAAKASLVKAGVTSYYEGEYKVQAATRDAAYEKVGGEENWNKLKTWVNDREAKDPAFKVQADNARKAIAIGGQAAEDAVVRLKAAYEADPKNSSMDTKIERGDARVKPGADVQPLTRKEYFQLKEAAVRNRRPQSEIDALFARRQAGQAKGI
jgi:nitrogen regulatory protein PII-like uncharacterized protein